MISKQYRSVSTSAGPRTNLSNDQCGHHRLCATRSSLSLTRRVLRARRKQNGKSSQILGNHRVGKLAGSTLGARKLVAQLIGSKYKFEMDSGPGPETVINGKRLLILAVLDILDFKPIQTCSRPRKKRPPTLVWARQHRETSSAPHHSISMRKNGQQLLWQRRGGLPAIRLLDQHCRFPVASCVTPIRCHVRRRRRTLERHRLHVRTPKAGLHVWAW